MNNILSFNEYNGYELERMVYDEILNEKSSLNSGVRGFLNRRASRKVKSELSEEIEMSKSIMEGIKTGLESLSENFDEIQKSLDNTNSDKKKGEKQKLLDDITKILESSKKNTWDINELIDEGEIDYTGFTANIGISSIAYFGILLTPFRAVVMIHKGYNYFFGIVKNTIRKALVMLQLNFDQFENLIVTQGMKCAGVITADDFSNEIESFYGNMLGQIGSSKELTKKQIAAFERAMKGAKEKFEQQRRSMKDQSAAENLYNNIDPYNNTYTKSLEALRQYSSDDVQKYLDSIKASMSKLAGQEADLQTYSELILAAAEEHAYKVSSSIYNKFAKMTEVFSLPNQKKLIDLILAANKEQKKEAKKIRDEKKKNKELQENFEKNSKKAEEGIKVFKSIDGIEIGELEGGEVSEEDGESRKKYDPSTIKGAKKWTYKKFSELNEDDRYSFELWLKAHPEVLKECGKTLQVAIYTPWNEGYHEYVDSLIDIVGLCISEKISDSHILNYSDYLFEAEGKEEPSDTEMEEIDDDVEYDFTEEEKEELKNAVEKLQNSLKDFLKEINPKLVEPTTKDELELSDEDRKKLAYCYDTFSGKSPEKDFKFFPDLEKINKTGKVKASKLDKCYLDFREKNLDKSEFEYLRKLYKNKEVSIAALKTIGNNILKDKTFVKNSENIVNAINECLALENRRKPISIIMYNLLKNSVDKLKLERDNEYPSEDESNNKEEKGEK